MKLLILFLIVCSLGFSESMEEKFNSYKTTMENLPQDDYARELLEKYKPRIYIHKDSYEPMDFYEDYLPSTTMECREEKLKIDAPTRKDVEEHFTNDKYYLDLRVPKKKYLNREIEVNPKVYGRIYRDKIGDKNYLFLKYNTVFPYSGLPAGISKVKLMFSKLISDPKAWHELDIHGAYHLLIDEETMKPVGVLLNQHNYHKSYLLDENLKLPNDNRMEIAIAKDSNEPYLWNRKSEKIRTAGAPFKNLAYVYHRTNWGGLNSGCDYIGGVEEIEVGLEMLSPEDPLYKGRMLLGDRKKILGFYESWYLAGPPGMDYYTHLAVKNLGDLYSVWLIDPKDEKIFEILDSLDLDFMKIDLTELTKYQVDRMTKILSGKK